ncbi:MAG TPA: hypothetical protein VHQ90_00890 [Thermoanaerobaculia bacterium]|nr:hypothetical protein [Thermoanaerobaculia bacterium]
MAGIGTTIQIAPDDVEFLARRGARPHRGGGHFSRSAVLQRALRTLRLLLEHSDPRTTRGLPEEMHAVALALIPLPCDLTGFELRRLADILAESPDFPAHTGRAGIDPQDFLAAIAALSFPEKVALVDQALQAHLQVLVAALDKPRRPVG